MGDPPKPGIIFWRADPLWNRLPPLGKCLGTHLDQGTSWHCCERLHSASVNFFFEDSLNTFAHFMMGDLRAHLPTPHWLFSSFWPKTGWSPCPTCPIYPILPWANVFCFPGWKKVLKGKSFADEEEEKQKMVETLKGIKIDEFKNYFEQWEKTPQKVYCIKWRVLWRWLKFKHVRINTQFL